MIQIGTYIFAITKKYIASIPKDRVQHERHVLTFNKSLTGEKDRIFGQGQQ